MATNSVVVASLEAQPVPADRECVRTTSEILKAIEDYVAVTGLASSVPGATFPTPTVPGTNTPTTNNVAAQALAKAEDALARVTALEGGPVRERRNSQARSPLQVGDHDVTITWAPPMPSAVYEVRITLWGAAGDMGPNKPGFMVIAGSETASSVSINTWNCKQNMSYSFVIESLEESA